MLLKTLQLTARNYRNLTRLASVESCLIIPVQNYARFVPRKSKIVNDDELFEVNIEDEPAAPTPRTVKQPKEKLPKSKAKDTDECNKSMSANVHTILENDKMVSSIMTVLRSKKTRKNQDKILLEGVRLIEDALDAKVKLETLIFSRWEDVRHLPVSKNTEMYKVPYKSIQLWSTLTTSPGVMGIFKKPPPIPIKRKSLPITVICDNIRDPGNMGSILRAAAGVGVEKIILTKGCVDFWDSKVLRSAAGAHFRIPVYSSMEWEDILGLLNEEARVYVADNDAKLSKIDDERDVTDSEGEEEHKEEEEEEVEEDNLLEKVKKQKKLKEQRLELGSQSSMGKHKNIFIKLNNIPIVPYFAVDYTRNQIILIVGGETEGVSVDSYKLIQSRQGIRVNIPLDNGVESLNSGMALGIVAFEMKRQLLTIIDQVKQQLTN